MKKNYPLSGYILALANKKQVAQFSTSALKHNIWLLNEKVLKVFLYFNLYLMEKIVNDNPFSITPLKLLLCTIISNGSNHSYSIHKRKK